MTTSSDDEINLVESASDDATVQVDHRRGPRPPPSPATTRKMPLAGTSLKLKKGRRARHRYDSERSLFASVDFDPDEAPDGWDIAQENTSHFRALLDPNNRELLEQFLDMNEPMFERIDNSGKITDGGGGKTNAGVLDPEASFLRISSHLRRALKKHMPWVYTIKPLKSPKIQTLEDLLSIIEDHDLLDRRT
jgi:hypothetical protein